LEASKEDLLNIGLTRQAANSIFKHKASIIKQCFMENRWKAIHGTYENWIRLAERVKSLQIAQIDTVVTSDIHRLIRANGTLHGKTGMLKAEFPLRELDEFDPFVGAVAFKEGTAQVQVSVAPEFRMSGETFGPFKNEKVELPTAAAVLLVLKGRAEVLS
jgi:DNA primase catalytic subunit